MFYEDEDYGWGHEYQPSRVMNRDPNQPSPFNHSRLYGTEKYSLQNMILNEVSFPRPTLPKGFTSFDIWSDRSSADWYKATEGLKSTMSADAYFAGLSNQDVLEFARRIAAAVEFKHKVTGASIVRYTNASSGYPCLRLTIVGKK